MAVYKRHEPFFLELERSRILWADRYAPGKPLGDLLLVILPGTSDEERREAARRFMGRRRPIHPKRWEVLGKAIRRELEGDAEAHRWTPDDEMDQRALTALFEAARILDGIPITAPPAIEPEMIAAVLRTMNDLLTEDILGPAWRRKGGNVSPGSIAAGLEIAGFVLEREARGERLGKSEDFEEADFVRQIHAENALQALLRNATAREKALASELLRGATLADAAKTIGMSPGAARQAWSRFTRKASTRPTS